MEGWCGKYIHEEARIKLSPPYLVFDIQSAMFTFASNDKQTEQQPPVHSTPPVPSRVSRFQILCSRSLNILLSTNTSLSRCTGLHMYVQFFLFISSIPAPLCLARLPFVSASLPPRSWRWLDPVFTSLPGHPSQRHLARGFPLLSLLLQGEKFVC